MKLYTFVLLVGFVASHDTSATYGSSASHFKDKHIFGYNSNFNKKHLRSLRMRNKAKQSGFDCLNGCRIDSSEMVCANGVTYQNTCLAQ